MSELIRECPNDECEHKQDNSKMRYSCGWLEAKHHLLPTPDSKEYQELRVRIARITMLSDMDDNSVIHSFSWEKLCQDFPHSIEISLQIADKVLALLGGKE